MSASPSSHTGTREPATVRVAMWSARHRWLVVAVWFIATIGLAKHLSPTRSNGLAAMLAKLKAHAAQALA